MNQMANKRCQETQDVGERSRELRANLREHPMLPQEAARVICDVHTAPGVSWASRSTSARHPIFVNVDGNLYWEASRVLRCFAQLD
jgi:hypothetical protein